MNRSICVIHGGNKKVAKSLYDSFDGQILGCITNPFPGCNDLSDNINYLTDHAVICDLSTADSLSIDEMLAIQKNVSIVKYISTYEDDLLDIERVWNGNFDHESYLQSCQRYMIFADEIMDLRPKNYAPIHPPIVFSPGRSGTNAFVNLLDDRYPGIDSVHHDFYVASIDKLINSQHTYMVTRRNVLDFVMSVAISKQYNTIMKATPETFDQDVITAKSWQPFDITKEQVHSIIVSNINWLNIALYITKINPNTTFTFFEDLDMSKVDKVIKNPYDKNKLIANLDELNHWMKEFSNYDKFIKDVIFKNWSLV